MNSVLTGFGHIGAERLIRRGRSRIGDPKARIGAGTSGKGDDTLPGSQVLQRRWRIRRFGLPLSLVALLLLFFFPWPGFFYDLRVIHVQSRRNLLTLPFLSGQTFNISFINSLYNAPVAEIFEANGSEIPVAPRSAQSSPKRCR